MVSFSPAYIHKSEGQPGFDPGTGWTQAARLTFESGEIYGDLPDFPCSVWSGCLKFSGCPPDGAIPIPLHSITTAELELVFDEIHKIQIRGKEITLSLLGKESFVENFPGHSER